MSIHTHRKFNFFPSVLFVLIGFICFFVELSTVYSASQNKLISKKLTWKVAQTEHFDLYYYQGAEQLLVPVSVNLEKAYQKVTQQLRIPIPGRSPFFLFLNHNDFEQNNIVDVGEGTGGVTEAFKNRLLIFNDGTQKWLEYVTVHEFTHELQFEVLYSGFWKSARLLKSVLYPLWFMEGMAEYFSGDIDEVQKEMILRDAVTTKEFIPLKMLHGFNHVKPHQVTLAYKTGDAALSFIAREYGEDKIGILLKNLEEKFDINSVLQEILGLNLSQLDAKLLESLEEKYSEEIQTLDLKEPDFYGQMLTHPDHLYPVFNSNPAFFPDGKAFVYLSDKEGYVELFRYDLTLSRASSLNIQKSFPGLIENIHQDGSALSVSPDGRTILFAGESNQKDYLYLYDSKRNELRRLNLPLENVSSPQFSPDGKKIVFVGMKDGITNLYICQKDGKEFKQLTDTFEDENYPRFFPDGKRILFSREFVKRDSCTVYERQLWVFSLESGLETQLTFLPGKKIQPAISPSGTEITFVDDVNGISDLYRISVNGGNPTQLTQVVGGNFYPVYSPDGKEIVFVSHRHGEQHLYKTPVENLVLVQKSADKTSASLSQLPQEFQRRKNEIENPTAPNESFSQKNTETLASPALKDESAMPPANFSLRGGRPYRFNASTDFFFPILFYSSTDGLYLSAYWQASEMLGNHQIQAAVTYASAYDFLNYQVYYSYLKYRPQFYLGFLGDTQENVLLTTRESRREDAQFVGVAYPLNRFDKIQLRFLTTQRREQFTDDSFVTVRFAGRENIASMSFSRDVSQGRYLEPTSGYRLSASYDESNESIRSSLDYRNFFLTFHKFVPFHKESTVALRIFGGGSMGQDKQFFRTGGSDMLRGYGRYDTNFAANHFVISNLEYRFPLFLNLDYHVWFLFPDFLFKNIYGVVFMDTGILWDTRDQILNYSSADTKNSLGLGLKFQTFVLQTFPIIIQLDWARRTADGDQTFYISLGPNF